MGEVDTHGECRMARRRQRSQPQQWIELITQIKLLDIVEAADRTVINKYLRHRVSAAAFCHLCPLFRMAIDRMKHVVDPFAVK